MSLPPASSTLALSGWAQPHDALDVIAPGALHFDYRPYRSMQEVTQHLHAHSPSPRIAIGWSLGGALLLHAVSTGAVRPACMVLIAAPYQFVATESFPHAMDPLTFERFHTGYRKEPERTAQRFAGLISSGDIHQRRILEDFPTHPTSSDADTWHHWLDALAAHKAPVLQPDKAPSTLIIHGDGDVVVHPGQGAALADAIPGARLTRLEGCGHAPHWHDAERVKALISTLCA